MSHVRRPGVEPQSRRLLTVLGEEKVRISLGGARLMPVNDMGELTSEGIWCCSSADHACEDV